MTVENIDLQNPSMGLGLRVKAETRSRAGRNRRSRTGIEVLHLDRSDSMLYSGIDIWVSSMSRDSSISSIKVPASGGQRSKGGQEQ